MSKLEPARGEYRDALRRSRAIPTANGVLRLRLPALLEDRYLRAKPP